MKILCVCQKGNSRSVALAWLFKCVIKKHDALAMGVRTSSKDTKKMLYEWADLIILTTTRYQKEIPEEHRSKLIIWHVGTDIYHKGFDEDLIRQYKAYYERDKNILLKFTTRGDKNGAT